MPDFLHFFQRVRIKRIWLILSVLMIRPQVLTAQRQQASRIDLLLQKLAKTKEDTGKVNLLRDIAMYYQYIDHEKAMLYAEENMALARKMQWIKGIIQAYETFGKVDHSQNSDSTALLYFKQGAELAEKYHLPSLYYRQLMNEGDEYMLMKKYDQATKMYKLAYDYFNLTSQAELTSYALRPIWFTLAQKLGRICRLQHKDAEAIHFF